MKCTFGISDFLEEIPSLSHSVVFLYFFALIAEEGFLISSCYSLNSAFRCLYLSFSPLLFASLLSRQPFYFFALLFHGDGLDPCLLYNVTNLFHSSSGTLSIRSRPLNHKLESRLPGEISITSDMQMTPPLWQKVKRNSKASS